MSYLIALDDGHEYNTPGKRTPKFENGSFMHEWEFNNRVKEILKEELIRCGFRIIDCNPDKKETSLAERVKIANNAGADFYLSIHANALNGTWGTHGGIETYAILKGGEGERIGRIIHKYLLQGTKLRDRGVKDGGWLYVVKNTKMPAVLVECAFMDNKYEAELLRSEAYRQECAVELAKALCEGFKITYKAKQTETVPSKSEVYAYGVYKNNVYVKGFNDYYQAVAHCKEINGSFIKDYNSGKTVYGKAPVPVHKVDVSKYPVLKKNSTGEYVKTLQTKLGGLSIDGSFGPLTDTAVRAFQKKNGLVVDGVVGPKTWDKLING
ncbi:N-acetylmuramoyl-L-alanine amidase [Paenibacillus contaminans]|uniref:MurNAc-LAA domain-containing protein n=1 Tax=Paenibacillus contaminans TaxID=450362 RepID=A0A329MTH0_9BACL|nr:N-acetylmuramoyl-L-alanine amidase [Paenibacillus contaminans]RAV22686.1 hypothetical protein DQG23_00245 [Paenibacillus contaminans]